MSKISSKDQQESQSSHIQSDTRRRSESDSKPSIELVQMRWSKEIDLKSQQNTTSSGAQDQTTHPAKGERISKNWQDLNSMTSAAQSVPRGSQQNIRSQEDPQQTQSSASDADQDHMDLLGSNKFGSRKESDDSHTESESSGSHQNNESIAGGRRSKDGNPGSSIVERKNGFSSDVHNVEGQHNNFMLTVSPKSDSAQDSNSHRQQCQVYCDKNDANHGSKSFKYSNQRPVRFKQYQDPAVPIMVPRKIVQLTKERCVGRINITVSDCNTNDIDKNSNLKSNDVYDHEIHTTIQKQRLGLRYFESNTHRMQQPDLTQRPCLIRPKGAYGFTNDINIDQSESMNKFDNDGKQQLHLLNNLLKGSSSNSGISNSIIRRTTAIFKPRASAAMATNKTEEEEEERHTHIDTDDYFLSNDYDDYYLQKFSLLLGNTPTERRLSIFKYYNLFITLLLLLIPIFLGAISIMFLEDWRFLDGLYWSVVSTTTVGLGDLSPKSRLGKIFCIFYIILGSIIVGIAVNNIASMKLEVQAIEQALMFETQRLSPEMLSLLDREGNGVDCFEFCLGSLIIMRKLDRSDLMPIVRKFQELDIDGSGTLTKLDLMIGSEFEGLEGEGIHFEEQYVEDGIQNKEEMNGSDQVCSFSTKNKDKKNMSLNLNNDDIDEHKEHKSSTTVTTRISNFDKILNKSTSRSSSKFNISKSMGSTFWGAHNADMAELDKLREQYLLDQIKSRLVDNH